jgi:hypothetical protein
VLIALIFLIVGKPVISATEQDLEEKKQMVVSFIQDVVGINVSLYTLNFISRCPEVPDGEWGFTIYLNGENGSTRALFDVERGMIRYFKCYDECVAVDVRQGKSTLQVAREIAETFYSNITYDVQFRTKALQLLERAVPDQNQTIKDENLTLRIGENGRDFRWDYEANGTFVLCAFSLRVSENGHLLLLFNTVGVLSIVWDVRVSEEQAKAIALPYAQVYATANGRTIESVTAKFRYDRSDDRYTVSPQWFVEVLFERNGGYIYGYSVLLFANSGVPYSFCELAKAGGEGAEPNYLPIFLTIAILTLAPLISFAAYRRRSLKKKIDGE